MILNKLICPFCGKAAKTISWIGNKRMWFTVSCFNEKCPTHPSLMHPHLKRVQAIKDWNKWMRFATLNEDVK